MTPRASLLAACSALVLVSGCGGSATPASEAASRTAAAQAPTPPAKTSAGKPSPAKKLAGLDGDTQPVAAYQHALDRLAPKCTEPPDKLAAFAWFGSNDLAKYSISESGLQVLQHMHNSVTKGIKMNCQGVLAAYLVLREGK